MHQLKLNPQDEALRQRCEAEALKQWPGARVLVDGVPQGIRAAVYLAEDGTEPAASAQASEPRVEARDALDELLGLLERPPTGRG